jgi:hypothetical protein
MRGLKKYPYSIIGGVIMRNTWMACSTAFLAVGSIALPLLAAAGSGSAARPRTTPPIGTQLAELKGVDTVPNDAFANSVAISGTTAIVGSLYYAAGAGRAYVFTETVGVWHQLAELKGFDTIGTDNFGSSVAISGTTAMVGARGHAARAGRVYVFTETAGHWHQVAELKGSDTVAGDGFGSVAISGTTAIVGAPGYFRPNRAGRAYVFTETAGHWHQVAELKGSFPTPSRYDYFGSSVAISGSTAIVGSPGYSEGAGSAYVFAETAGAWRQVAWLAASRTVFRSDSSFGQAVAISGSTALVGAPGDRTRADRAYVFTETKGVWHQVGWLKGSDTLAGDLCGSSVTMSGTTATVGAPRHAVGGRTYVFRETADSWKQVGELKASDTFPGDSLGGSASISGSIAIVGANGRAYVFEA